MIDIDEYIEMWDDNLLGSEGVQILMNTLIAEVKRLREDNKKLHDAINGCAYRGSEGSALDLYCESIIERCPTCDENVESGLCDEECEEE